MGFLPLLLPGSKFGTIHGFTQRGWTGTRVPLGRFSEAEELKSFGGGRGADGCRVVALQEAKNSRKKTPVYSFVSLLP